MNITSRAAPFVAWMGCAALVFGCTRSRGDAPSPAPALDAGMAAQGADASATAATNEERVDAAALPPRATRSTYAAAMAEGRARTREKKYAAAIAAFSRALDALPYDTRALAERGYARLLDGDDDRADDDLDRALSVCDEKDTTLRAQIEFNMGLVADHRAKGADGGAFRNAAVGHYRRSNALHATKAAAAKGVGCPVAWRTIAHDVTVFSSREAAVHALGNAPTEWQPLQGNGDDTTRVDGEKTQLLVKVDGSKVAHVDVGPTSAWRCGTFGTVTIAPESERTLFRVQYQPNRSESGPGLCFCEDGETCNGYGQHLDDAPACKCENPTCPLTCGNAGTPDGTQTTVFLDARTGAGLWEVEVDTSLADQVSFGVTDRLRIVGAGCDIEVMRPDQAK